MTRKQTAKNCKISPLCVVLALSLELTFMPCHAAPNTDAAQAMTIRTTAETLSAKQRAIPLIAVFMATSDMPRLNATLNQGLDAPLSTANGGLGDNRFSLQGQLHGMTG